MLQTVSAPAPGQSGPKSPSLPRVALSPVRANGYDPGTLFVKAELPYSVNEECHRWARTVGSDAFPGAMLDLYAIWWIEGHGKGVHSVPRPVKFSGS